MNMNSTTFESNLTGGYPGAPGVRPGATGETSAAAAAYIAPHVGGMCATVLALIRIEPATPEELQERFQAFSPRRILLTTVRARVCQLRALGLVVDEGSRGIGESGRARVIRWRVSTAEEYATYLAQREAR